MVNKTRMIEQIAELARERRVEGISDLRDESDRDGMRVVVELKRDANAQIVLNRLYKHTQMQSTFGAIMLALVDGVPKIMNLKEMIQHFVDHRHEVIVRRTAFDLRNAEDREHILVGLRKAVDNIDAVVEIIKKAKDPDAAGKALRKRFKLSEKQSEAILNMRLARLTGLEVSKLKAELKEVRALIKELKAILASKKRRMTIVKKELDEVAERYGDSRRTEIAAEITDLSSGCPSTRIVGSDAEVAVSPGWPPRTRIGWSTCSPLRPTTTYSFSRHQDVCTGSRCTKSRRPVAQRADGRSST
jgi:DNA gyrase subunit A